MESESERRLGMEDLATNMALMNQTLKENTAMTVKVHDRLFGNGEEGLVTTVALSKAAIKRLWWVVGLGTPAILTVCIGAFLTMVK